jgi:hypothetical protein
MTTTHSPITYALKTLSLCVLMLALIKSDALSRYLQQQWRIALPFSGNLSSPTWFNRMWDANLWPIDSAILTFQSRLNRAGQALTADPAPAEIPQPPLVQRIAPCKNTNSDNENPSPNSALQSLIEWPIPLVPGDKILLVGDSMMQGVAPYVISSLRKQFAAGALDLSRHSTGLAYPGFFNWPDTIKANLSTTHYKALVIFLGANDTWDIIHKGKAIGIGNQLWRSLYTERVESILSFAQENSVQVIWLGVPPMGRETMNKYIPALNQVYEESIKKYAPLGMFTPTAKSLSLDGHTFYKSLLQAEQGEVLVRTNDGVHFTPAGQKIIARLVLSHFRVATNSITAQ